MAFRIDGLASEDIAKFGGMEGFKAAVVKKVQEVLPEGVSVASIERAPTSLDPLIVQHTRVLTKGVRKIGVLENDVLDGKSEVSLELDGIAANTSLAVEALGGPEASIDRITAALRTLISEATDLYTKFEDAQPHPLNVACPVHPDKLTPLHLAAISNAPKTLATVLDAPNADWNVRNKFDETPLEYFVRRHWTQSRAAVCARLMVHKMSKMAAWPDPTIPVDADALAGQSDEEVLLFLREKCVAKQLEEIRNAKRKVGDAAEQRAKAAKTE